MKIFKTKGFARDARREGVSDDSLIKAVQEAESGLIEADLGGGVLKQRVARPGGGKSSGYRVILAYQSETRSFFLYLFAKSDLANIEPNQLLTFRDLARSLINTTDADIEKAKKSGKLFEVQHGKNVSKKGSAKAEGGKVVSQGRGARRSREKRK